MIEEKFISLLLETAEYYKAKEDYQESAKWLKKGLLYEPLHRELNYRLIESLLLSSEHRLAAKYYDIYKRGLLKELKEEPDIAFKKILLKN